MLQTQTDADAYRERLLSTLENLLGSALAIRGIDLWDRNFAESNPFAVIEFVNEVSIALRLQSKQRHELRVAIYKNLMVKDAQPSTPVTPIAPLSKATVVPLSSANAMAAQPVAFLVFESLCKHMQHAVMIEGVITPREIAETLYRTLIVDYDQDAQAETFARWCAGQGDLEGLVQGTSDKFSLYLQKFHAVLRELLGLELADRLLRQAITATESLPAAAAFPPKRLL